MALRSESAFEEAEAWFISISRARPAESSSPRKIDAQRPLPEQRELLNYVVHQVGITTKISTFNCVRERTHEL